MYEITKVKKVMKVSKVSSMCMFKLSNSILN